MDQEPEIDQLDLLSEERKFVQETLFTIMNDGTRNYHGAFSALLAMRESTCKEDPKELTMLGKAIESVLVRVECELFGDFLDD